MIRALALSSLLILTACAEPLSRAVTMVPEDIQRFAPKNQPRGVARSNVHLAEDFLDLTFQLENGDRLPILLKYPGPINVILRTDGLSTYQPELSNLLRRMRSEARLDIRQTNDPETAQIHVHALSRAQIDRAFPGAACVVIPGITSWEDLRSKRASSGQILWSKQQELSQASIFVPADSTPQDTRDCLHEELAQALGPANDLYHVPDTIFNDDNFHSILTPFDMLMLRTLYDKRLKIGMSREEVAKLVPSILNNINPKGRFAPKPRAGASTFWSRAIEDALDRRRSYRSRERSAIKALEIAQAMEPQDHRLGMTYLTLGRLAARRDLEAAEQFYRTAYDQLSDTLGWRDFRVARAAWHLAIFAKRRGDIDEALRLANRHIPIARKAENAITLSGLLAVKADAHWARGELAAAKSAQREAWAWSPYAFGDAATDARGPNPRLASTESDNS